jgi:hypothetical protein
MYQNDTETKSIFLQIFKVRKVHLKQKTNGDFQITRVR